MSSEDYADEVFASRAVSPDVARERGYRRLPAQRGGPFTNGADSFDCLNRE